MKRAAALATCLLLAALPSPARAYITAPVQTLGQLCSSTYITVVQVEKFHKDKGIIIYRKVKDLKGVYPQERIRHAFDLKNTPQHKGSGDVPVRPDEVDWRYALDWAAPGKMAVVFSLKYDPYGDFGHTYIDKCWYATMCPARDWDFWWSIYSDRALLTRWHCGSPEQLAGAVEKVLAGNTAVVPTLVQGSRDDLRQGRGTIKGLKVSLQLQDFNPTRDLVADALFKELPALLKDLENPDRNTRLGALRDLAGAGSEARPAAARLRPLAQDPDEELRLAALMALSRLDPSEAAIVPGALPFLKHAEPERRMRAVEILAECGKAGTARSAAGALATTLKDPNRELRILVAETLGRLGADATEAIPALAETVRSDSSGTVRMRVADALVRIGPAANAARPALDAALKDPAMAQRPEVLQRIREALEKLK